MGGYCLLFCQFSSSAMAYKQVLQFAKELQRVRQRGSNGSQTIKKRQRHHVAILIISLPAFNLASDAAISPLKRRAIPTQRVLITHDPVSLISKRQERAGHAVTLQCPEETQRFRRWRSVVFVAVGDKCRRCIAKMGEPIRSSRVKLI